MTDQFEDSFYTFYLECYIYVIKYYVMYVLVLIINYLSTIHLCYFRFINLLIITLLSM